MDLQKVDLSHNPLLGEHLLGGLIHEILIFSVGVRATGGDTAVSELMKILCGTMAGMVCCRIPLTVGA